MTGRERFGGQGGIASPAAVRRAELTGEDILREEAHVQEDSAGEEYQVAESVQSRERHITRAAHQRDHEVTEGCAERHSHEEHHPRSVQRENAAVLVRVEEARMPNDDASPK